jgi:high mobility group protein 2-like 1
LDPFFFLARCSLLYLSDLEVTGISRSGRVRKKSSKLVDFESPDDLTENKLKRQKAQLQNQQLLDQYEVQQQQQQQILPVQTGSIGRQRKNSDSNHTQQKVKTETLSDNETQSSGSESDDPSGINEDERYSMDSGSDNEVDPLMIDDRETGFRKLEPPSGQETSQANSLYMLEKCKKKLIIKDGKIIGKMKAQRKDKGVCTNKEQYQRIALIF